MRYWTGPKQKAPFNGKKKKKIAGSAQRCQLLFRRGLVKVVGVFFWSNFAQKFTFAKNVALKFSCQRQRLVEGAHLDMLERTDRNKRGKIPCKITYDITVHMYKGKTVLKQQNQNAKHERVSLAQVI